jgi:hypothetical protein
MVMPPDPTPQGVRVCHCRSQEAHQLVEHWRMEAEQQRHSAASARAPETARSIKLLQDSKLAADEALLQKEKELLKVCGRQGLNSVHPVFAVVSLLLPFYISKVASVSCALKPFACAVVEPQSRQLTNHRCSTGSCSRCSS